MLDNTITDYITNYIQDDYEEAARFFFIVLNHFKNLDNTELKSNFESYIHTFIAHDTYMKKVIGDNFNKKKVTKNLDIYIDTLDFETQNIIDIISGGPESLLIAMNNYDPEEIALLQENPHRTKVDTFSITLGPVSENKIFFLYDYHSRNFYDYYLGRNMPINGTHYNAYDYHLPIYLLVKKYFPQYNIILSNDNSAIADNAYIYVQTFTHFFDFMCTEHKNFHKNIPNSIWQDLISGRAIIVFNFLQEAHINSYHFRYLAAFMGDLPEDVLQRIFFFSGNMDDASKWGNFIAKKPTIFRSIGSTIKNLAQILKNKNNLRNINFYSFRYFEEAVQAQQIFFEHITFEQKKNYLKNTKDFRYFLCLNRIVKDYRIAISHIFYKHKILEKAYISQGIIPDEFNFNYYKLLQPISEQESTNFKKTLPYLLDSKHFVANLWNILPYHQIYHSFLWVVTESVFLPFFESNRINFKTEKTYKPILYFMPFIIVGNCYSLRDLQQEGYRTFSDYWDESYDEIHDPVRRMKKIEELIVSISKKTPTEIQDWYSNMEDILIHNYNTLMNSRAGCTAITKLVENYNLRDNKY